MLRYIYILGTFLAIFFIQSCSDVDIYNPNFYKSNSPEYDTLPNLTPTFVLCQEMFAKVKDVDYEANLACSTVKKKARLVKQEMFKTCYLIAPISNTYECIE